MTGPEDLYRFEAMLLPWKVRGLSTLAAYGLTGTAWHDGDTCNIIVSKGLFSYDIIHLRCAGYNSAEVTGATKPQGLADADYARSLADTQETIYVNSLAFTAGNEEDNFARMLGYVTLDDGLDLATTMINAGHGVPDDPQAQLRRFLAGRL